MNWIEHEEPVMATRAPPKALRGWMWFTKEGSGRTPKSFLRLPVVKSFVARPEQWVANPPVLFSTRQAGEPYRAAHLPASESVEMLHVNVHDYEELEAFCRGVVAS